MTTPQTATQFLNTLGVNVHVEYTDGKYANATNVVADLAYLGETHVRDAVLDPGNQGQSSYDALAAAGIKFNFFVQGQNLSSTLALVDAFVQRHPGAVSMIEGPNEVNNFPISYAGQSGNAAATAFQAALYSAVKGDAHLSGVPVADLTSWPFLGGSSDYSNYHFYPTGGAQPLAATQATLTALAPLEPGKPTVMTEGGYNTMLTDPYYGGVDELTQAKLTLNLYCDNAKLGVTSTYIYQLLDAYADPTNSNSDDHFGLFNLDNTPKLAATAIHNLTSILSSGADASATATSLSYTVSNLPALGSVLALTKNSTTHDILIWNEPTIWDGSTHTEIAAPATQVTVHLANVANVVVFDPLTSTQVATYTATKDIVVAVTDHPEIIEVTDLPASSQPATTPSAGSTPPAVSVAANHAPALSGAMAIALSDHAVGAPFASMSISDADVGQSETVTVAFNAGAGVLSGGGFTQTTPGVYQVTATSAAAAQADLRAVSFAPTVQPGGTPTTINTFTVTVSDGQASTTDSNTSVAVAHQANSPVSLAGFTTGQTVADKSTAAPFANVSVVDPDLGQTETVVVTLSSSALGSLSGGGFSAVSGAPGVYQAVTGSAAQAQAALRGLVFTPAQNVTHPGTTSLETFTVQVSDGASTAHDASTTELVSSINDAPAVSGLQSSATLPAGGVVLLQPGLSITDPDLAAAITSAEVEISGFVAGDRLTVPTLPVGVTAAYDASSGVLRLTGTGSDAAYGQALSSLTFSHDGQASAGTRTLTQAVTDDGGATTTWSETVSVAGSTPAPSTSSNGATPMVASYTTQSDNLLRVSASDAALADTHSSLYVLAQTAATLGGELEAGKISAAAAQSALLHLADATTSVAEMSYDFFTGATPTSAGLSYLVHSDANSSDLNDAYYAQFSMQNRYINFAVALAKGGSGTADYHAAYDNLSLTEATAKAYDAVFGAQASSDKIATILNASVPDGTGGSETRAQYFASYGGDGPNGSGTKAAMIGWLLADSVSEGVGSYQAAETHFLQDLAHGTAQFGIDLLAVYGTSPNLVGQATLDPTLGH